MSDYDDVLTRGAYRFGVTYQHDHDTEAPWEAADGHGIVTDWTTRAKSPGERVLAEDCRSKRYYDVAATLKLAKRDGWGPSKDVAGETKAQRIVRAVEEDFEFLSTWCRDVWAYVGVTVAQIDDEDQPTGPETSLWGVETWKDYHHTVAQELVDELLREIEVSTPDAVLSEN